jgi:hypothetical protein
MCTAQVDWRRAEAAFWAIVEEGEDPVDVLYGADLDTTRLGSGFPRAGGRMADSPYAAAPWNLNNMPRLPGVWFFLTFLCPHACHEVALASLLKLPAGWGYPTALVADVFTPNLPCRQHAAPPGGRHPGRHGALAVPGHALLLLRLAHRGPHVLLQCAFTALSPCRLLVRHVKKADHMLVMHASCAMCKSHTFCTRSQSVH